MTRKTLNRVVALLLVAIFIIPMNTVAFAGTIYNYEDFETFHNNLAENFGWDFAVNYHQAVAAFEHLYDNFPRNRMGEIVYPQYFGGVYIDDFGNLNILTVTSPFAVFSYADAIAPFSSNQLQVANFREVQFSLNELWDTQNMLNELIPSKWDFTPAAINARSWFIDVINNRIVVELEDFNQHAVEQFRETVFDAPILDFAEFTSEFTFSLEQLQELPFEHEYLNHDYHHQYDIEALNQFIAVVMPGDPIDIIRNGSRIAGGSVGYFANQWGRRGFVTAAHIGFGLRAGDNIFHLRSGRIIGSITSHSDVIGNPIDAAFVTLQPDVFFENITPSTGVQSTFVGIGVGFELSSISRSSGYRSGRVTSISQTLTFWTRNEFGNIVWHTVQNGMNVNMMTQGGDSGGLVHRNVVDEWGWLRAHVVGIVVAGTYNTTFLSSGFFINNHLGLQLGTNW